jgi:hypothetical protein
VHEEGKQANQANRFFLICVALTDDGVGISDNSKYKAYL